MLSLCVDRKAHVVTPVKINDKLAKRGVVELNAKEAVLWNDED